MGNWFSNIQIRRHEAQASFDAAHIAALIAKQYALEKADKDSADIEIAVFQPQGSPWITVVSDLIDGDIAALTEQAKALSQTLQTESLAIGCLDSDYLFLNLIDAPNDADVWASSGKYPDGAAPRKSNFAAWKPYVADAKSFQQAMRAKAVFAEECLYAVSPLLSLPVAQSMGDETACPEVIRFYFRYVRQEVSARPPAFACRHQPYCYHTGENPNLLSFLNQGDMSRGVAVCLGGPCVLDRQIEVTSICLQLHGKPGEWIHIPIDLQMTECSDGRRLHGECRDVRIPPAVLSELPMKKRMDQEFQRSISIRFSLADTNDPEKVPDKLGDLHVTLIPLKNVPGQCKVVLRHNRFPFRPQHSPAGS